MNKKVGQGGKYLINQNTNMSRNVGMKKSGFILVASVLFIFMAAQASLVSAQGIAMISLILTKQTPFPVEPGQVVSLELGLQNNGSGSESITLEIIPSSPFTLLLGQESKKTFGRVNAFDTVTQSYKLKVDETAVSATYDIEFRYYTGVASSMYVVKKIPVNVRGVPKFVIEDIQTIPESMEPGDEVEIIMVIKNEGSGEATQTELSLASVTDAETGESLIVPLLSGGVSYIGKIVPGEEKTAVFNLKIDIAAVSKTYMSTLTIDYKDENGETQTETHDLGIPVKGNPVIELLSAKIDNSDYKVDIENIGTGNAKALKIALVQDGEIKDSSVANELKPTKHKTIRFQGFRLGGAVINVSYLDEDNEFFVKEFPVTIKQSASAQETTGANTSPLATVLIVILVLESFYLWRLRKRTKK